MNTPSPVSGWEAERERLRKALEAAEYVATHADAIRRAFQHLHDTDPDDDDRAYYLHELAALNAVAALSESKEQTTADGWIEWMGGDCPVAGEVIVERRYRGSPDTIAKAKAATYFDWSHDPHLPRSDIIAYRVVSS